MGGHLHLQKRGSMWYWRRRLPSQSTGSTCITLSLRTTDRVRASIVARRLTAESDHMFDDIANDLLSPDDARAWLGHVLTAELLRARRSRIEMAITGAGEPGICKTYDHAKAHAWRIMARHGLDTELTVSLEAELREAGLSLPDISMVRLALERNASQLTDEIDSGKMIEAFRTLRPAAPALRGIAVAELAKILMEARAAAWSQLEGPDGLQIASDLAQKLAATVGGFTAELTAPPASPRHPDPCCDEKKDAAGPAVPVIRAAASDEHPSSDIPEVDPTLAAVVDRLCNVKAAESVSVGTRKQYRSCAELFSRITGITDVRNVRQRHLSTFRDTLLKMPKHYARSAKNADRPIADILRDAKSLPQDEVGLAIGTVNRHLEHIRLFCVSAAASGLNLAEKLDVSDLRLADKSGKRDRDKRAAFHQDELERLFTHRIWTGCRSAARRNDPGQMVIKDGLYWLPILGAYSGARREELAALRVEDIQQDEGIWFISIAENKNRDVKTAASIRNVPIHRRLIDLGFLDHVARHRNGTGDLFPELKPANHVHGHGKKYGDRIDHAWRVALETALDGNPRDLCFHSLRHYISDCLQRDPEVKQKAQDDLLGHESSGTGNRVYGEPTPLADLKAAVDRLPAVI